MAAVAAAVAVDSAEDVTSANVAVSVLAVEEAALVVLDLAEEAAVLAAAAALLM